MARHRAEALGGRERFDTAPRPLVHVRGRTFYPSGVISDDLRGREPAEHAGSRPLIPPELEALALGRFAY